MAPTAVANIQKPDQWAAYVSAEAAYKSALVQSGVLIPDERLDQFLLGGGLIFNAPAWEDIDPTSAAEGATDDTTAATATAMTTFKEQMVRLSRAKTFAGATLAHILAGADSVDAAAERVAIWRRAELQETCIATIKGVFADNAAAPDASEHEVDDLTHSILDDGDPDLFINGVTNFHAEAFYHTVGTMGDSYKDLALVLMHSVVHTRAKIANLIVTLRDSENNPVETFDGRPVIVDDSLPADDGVYETWLVGRGFLRLGMGIPMNEPGVEVHREPLQGKGMGVRYLINRWESIIHPVGHRFSAAAPADCGPSNATTINNLGHAASFKRVRNNRKHIKLARLISREFAPA